MRFSSALLLVLPTATIGAESPMKEACASSIANHGCSAYCGFDAVLAGQHYICLPSSVQTTAAPSGPFGIDAADKEELCDLVSRDNGCDHLCGFAWSELDAECRPVSGGKKEAATGAYRCTF